MVIQRIRNPADPGWFMQLGSRHYRDRSFWEGILYITHLDDLMEKKSLYDAMMLALGCFWFGTLIPSIFDGIGKTRESSGIYTTADAVGVLIVFLLIVLIGHLTIEAFKRLVKNP